MMITPVFYVPLKEKLLMNLLYLNSDKMGEGDQELGAKLMISYLTKLISNSVKIDAVFCANSAAYLSTTNTAAIELLKTMEANGAVVSTCGTCLEFFELKDSLKVGEIGSMDLLMTLKQQAQKIYQP
jgi:intracellular sulfur oxidation DsrE/DsrF family protein